jgi:hypothetical protein
MSTRGRGGREGGEGGLEQGKLYLTCGGFGFLEKTFF